MGWNPGYLFNTYQLKKFSCNFDLTNFIFFEDYPFQWDRTNGQTLDEQGIEGPKHDHAEQPQSE